MAGKPTVGHKRTESARAFLAGRGMARTAEFREALGLDRDQTKTVLQTLVNQGFAERVSYGLYRFLDRREDVRQAPMEDRIWTAMRVSTPSFSCTEVAMLAGTTTSYVYKRLREYRAEGFVAPAGQRALRGSLNGREKLWRLTGKGRDHLSRPKVEAYEPAAEVLLAVKINRLVCTGLALRFEDARDAAVRACRELEGMLCRQSEKNEEA